MKSLPGELYKELLDALLSAFPNYSNMEKMVRFHLDENLAAIAREGTLTDVAFDLIKWAEAVGQLDKLIQSARKANPGNVALLKIEEKIEQLGEKDSMLEKEITTSESLENLLKSHNIQSISLLSGFGNAPVGLEYKIFGEKIYLTIQKLGKNDEDNAYNHLDIFIPIVEFNIAENAPEQDKLFINELINFINSHAKIVRCSVENFADIPISLKNFEHLEELYIVDCENALSIPSDISALSNLRKIVVKNTGVHTIPSEVFGLPKLKSLDLSNNELTILPDGISHLTNLTELNLSGNRLTSLPAEIGQLSQLTLLNISNNKIESLPSSIGKLNKLESLIIHGNPLSIPPEIQKKLIEDPQSIIKSYFSSSQHERNPLNEIKLIVVGQGSVGKTSIIERILNNTYHPDEPKTEGISILRWGVPDLSSHDNKSKIKINIWDFGGQEIMHAMHQFFFTKRSLYMLVLDNRLTQDENRIEYWLKIIQSFGGTSPVLIVGNKADQHPLDIDSRGLQIKYSNIVEVLETSAATGEGIENLIDKISDQVNNNLEHVHDLLPVSWFEVKKILENLDEDYLSFESYVRLCEEKGISDSLSQNNLISFLHDLGVVLCYRDDPRLKENNILDPEWVTSGVYKILNSQQLFHKKGELSYQLLRQILDPVRYPDDKLIFIIDMLRKFELCYDIEPDKKFFIPDLLPRDEPYTGSWDNSLTFQYHYNVLPLSIISRFIVRMNTFIHKTVWRTGVVLRKDENTALVKADTENKRIYIWINGNKTTRRDFLSAIRTEFDSIHKTIARIDITEYVPVPGYPNADPIKFELLAQAERKGRRTIPHLVGGQLIDIDVKELLSGIVTESEHNATHPGTDSTNRTDVEELGMRTTYIDKKESTLLRIVTGIFISFPKIIGRFIIDIFGQHEPADSSSILLGWLVILVVILVLTGILTFDVLINNFEKAWRFLFPVQ